MSVRGLLAGGIILAALAGAVYWSERTTSAEKAAEETKGPKDKPKLVVVKSEDIARLDIRHKGTPAAVVLQQEKSGWKITQPANVRTDSEAASGVASAISGLTWDRLVEEKAGDLATFGLTDPAVQVTATARDGNKQTLQIGDETPTGAGFFAKLANDPRVFSINSGTKSSVDKTWKDLRDKRLLTFDDAKLSRVDLTTKGKTVGFSRKGKDEWQIVTPSLRADGLQIEEAVRKLRELKLDPAISEEDERKNATDFAAGTRMALVSMTDPSGTQTLEVRQRGDQYLAKSSAVEGAWKVTSDVAEGLNKTLDDFRNKKLFDFGFSDPSKIEIRDSGKNYSFLKTGGKWWFAGKEMDPTSVQSLIDKLREMTAARLIDTGFTTAAVEIAVTSLDGKRVEKLALSKGPKAWFARRENEPTIYEIENSKIEDLQRAAADVKPPPPPTPAPAPPKK